MKEENDDRLFRKWEVLKRWGIDGRKLAEYICDGLPAYDRHRRLLPTVEALAIDLQGNHEGFLTYLADQIAWLIIDDVKDFELVHGITPHDPAPAPAAPPVPVETSAAKYVTLTPDQEKKDAAREIAKKYIRGYKGPAPSIKEAVGKVKVKLAGSHYTDKTIRNWIKDLFPHESRKPGRRPKKT